MFLREYCRIVVRVMTACKKSLCLIWHRATFMWHSRKVSYMLEPSLSDICGPILPFFLRFPRTRVV